MAIVIAFECPGEPLCEVEAAPGRRIVDVCDESSAGVPFSCRSASCGTCRIWVVAGADLLDPPEEDETELLDLFGDDPSKRRLACQARLGPNAAGRLHLRVFAMDD